MSTTQVQYFGIRHHGPGCARSLVDALEALQPDCILVEGPPEANELLEYLDAAEMQPPVALLAYNTEHPEQASFFPFAEFSPEWQALRHARQHQLCCRFIDLPQSLRLHTTNTPQAEAAGDAVPAETITKEMRAQRRDPLGWLGEAAGFGDGESWWNHMVEERLDSAQLFASIQEAMSVLRSDLPDSNSDEEKRIEALREAYMRKCIREAQKEGFARIAVVCGAWHVPALDSKVAAKADNELLKGLPRSKIHCTWIPWTYRHLSSASGYGAGIISPGWYEHLWKTPAQLRSAAWLARIGKLLRTRGHDCSSAQIIDATRLADSLAALRQRASAGLPELNEAVQATIGMGDPILLRLIEQELVIGDRLGHVPANVPMVALQRDLEQQQKQLRLKPEALEKILDLDLRESNGLARSRLLHRLRLLGLHWGSLQQNSSRSKGSFHELWQLQWQPEFTLSIIEASRWGSTVLEAAAARTRQRAASATRLEEIAGIVDDALLADIGPAMDDILQALDALAATTGDMTQLMAALPALSRALRYGDVRQTRGEQLLPVLSALLSRLCSGLPAACQALDDEAAQAMRQHIQSVNHAIATLDDAAHLADWQHTLAMLAPVGTAHGLICGTAARLLLDAKGDDALAWQQLGLSLSSGTDALEGAAWLEGFFHQGGLLMLHDEKLWALVDEWLCQLQEERFMQTLPLLRRTFSSFSDHERQQLNQRARHGAQAIPASRVSTCNEQRANLPLPLLRRYLGLSPEAS